MCREVWSASCPAAQERPLRKFFITITDYLHPWKCLFIGGVHGIIAERWTVADLDFLELSIRVATGASDAGTIASNKLMSTRDV